MTWRTEEESHNWLPVLLTFLLGLLIGWWVIGWWLWPVTYTDALPQDLRLQDRQQYLTLVADSFASTGDVTTAEVRTATWPHDRLVNDLNVLQAGLAQQNPAEAVAVQKLAIVLNASTGAAAGTEQPSAAQVGATAGPTAAAQTTSGKSSSALRSLCSSVLWVVLFLAALVLGAFVWNRSRQNQQAAGGRRVPGSGRPPGGGWASRSGRDEQASSRTQDLKPKGAEGELQLPWDLEEPPVLETDEAVPGSPSPSSSGAPVRLSASTLPQNQPGALSTSTDRESSDEAPPLPNLAPTQATSMADEALVKLGEYTASYQAGEAGYDEAFYVEDEHGTVLGQCGLSLMIPLGRTGNQAAALQVWLWEERDSVTQAKVLMTESAYRDTALRDQLAEEYPSLAIKPGTEFDLGTNKLYLRGIVESLAYADQDSLRRQVFGQVSIRMRAFQRS